MPQTIRHVIVLMLENRSFDHMLGWMQAPDYPIEGPAGYDNPYTPCTVAPKVEASKHQTIALPRDPGHQWEQVNVQLFSNREGLPPGNCEPNRGFLASYLERGVPVVNAPVIMHGFEPGPAGSIPALTGLARTYAICDHWYSSVPGPTWPNRFFVHAASSKGQITNNFLTTYDMPSIFESLGAAGRSWKVYWHDFPLTTLLQRISGPDFPDNWASFGDFKRDAASGQLPNYAFIEPKYTPLFGPANDQHPPADVGAGDQLIDEVYHAIRTSPQWLESLLVVVHDEHGGLFDHVTPPSDAYPPNDGHTDQHFDFTRLGLRVPAVLISPFIPERTIVHTRLEHASVPATLKVLFGLSDFLTDRDRHANTFHGVAELDLPRTDLPERFRPVPLVPANDWGDSIDAINNAGTFEQLRASGDVSERSPTELQQSLAEAARQLSARMGEEREAALARVRPITTEHEAAVYIREVADRFHRRQQSPQ